MAKHISHQGKKFGNSHSSYTQCAGAFVQTIINDDNIKKISAGIIKTNLRNIQGRYTAKIMDTGTCVLVRFRGNISMQEVRFYAHSTPQFIDTVRIYCQNKDIKYTVVTNPVVEKK